MRIVAIVIVVAIVYLILSRNAPVGTAVEAIKESEAVALSSGPEAPASSSSVPAASSPAGTGSPSGPRSPIDRTHAVLDQVKQRNDGF